MKHIIRNNKRWRFIALSSLGLFICLLSFLYIRNLLDRWASYDPLQASIAQTEKLIEYINSYPSENIPPDNVPPDLSNEACWKMLKSSIPSSNNDYQISAFQNGYNPDPRGLEDLIVEIKFPNNRLIKLHYFRGRLIGCQRSES
jgi:hypothetical protein